MVAHAEDADLRVISLADNMPDEPTDTLLNIVPIQHNIPIHQQTEQDPNIKSVLVPPIKLLNEHILLFEPPLAAHVLLIVGQEKTLD